MGPDEIARILPHRYPFLFVDRVLEHEPGRRAVAILRVSADTPYTGSSAGGGHLPDMLIIEAMAQVGALAAAGADGVSGETGGMAGSGSPQVRGYLAGLNGAEFGRRAVPGDTVILTLEYVARMGNMVRFSGTATIEGEHAVSCGLTFTVEV